MATELTVNETTLDVAVTISNERGPAGPAGVVEAVEVGDITPVSSGKLIGRHGGGSGAAQEVGLDGGLEFQGANIRREALTGDVTASAGSNATTIAADAVTNTKLANMAEATIKGRASGAGTGDPQDLTAAQVQAIAVTAASIAAAIAADSGNVAASTGGNGAADSGKLVEFNIHGGAKFGSNLVANANTPIVDIRGGGSGFTLYVQNGGGGFAVEALPSTGTAGGAYSTHLTGSLAGVGLQIDGIGYGGTTAVGVVVWLPANGGPCFVAADENLNDRISIFSDGVIRFTQSGYTETNRVNLSAAVATGPRDVVLPDHSGTVMLATIKTTTGDPSAPAGGIPMVSVNTFDNTVKIYADGAWRTIASGW